MNEGTLPEPSNRHLSHRDYAQKTAELYDGIVDWYVRSFWNDTTDSDWVKLCVAATKGKTSVADIGSGPGNYARFFAEAGHGVCCIDISKEMVRRAISRLHGITGVVGDMRHLPFFTESFDCVFCAYSINHVLREDLGTTIGEFCRILRSGGTFCLMLKTGSLTYEFSNAADPASRGIMCLFGPDEIQDAIRAFGIQANTIQCKTETSEREFPHDKMLIIGEKAHQTRAIRSSH